MASETIPADNLGDESQQWRRWVEESLKKQGKFSRNYGLHQKANDKQKDAFGRALREAGLSQSELDAAVKDAKRKPAAPANAQIATDAYLAADGTPQSRVSMSTDVVTVDVNGKSINVANYQLYGRRNVAGTPWRLLAERESPALTFDPLPIGEEWQFKIHPVSAAGVVGEASAALLVTMARDITPPGKPAPMTATSRLGQVILSWNGKIEAGLANQPPDYSHSVVYVATSASAAGAAVGQIGTGGDTFYPPEVPYNQARWYFLVSYDKSGNASVPSDRVSIVTKPLVDTDIIGRVLDGANMKLDSIGEEALSGPVRAAIASGGGTMNYYQPDIPTGGSYSVGDTWFDSDDGYRISRWDGATWVEAKLGAGAIESASITNALIADATIQSAKIANLDAGKITTGELAAERIGAKTITVDKLIVASTGNMIPNGDFRQGISGWNASGSGENTLDSATVTDGPNGSTTSVARFSPGGNDNGFYPTGFGVNFIGGAEYVQGATYHFRLTLRLLSGTTGNARIHLGFHGEGVGNQWSVVDGTNLSIATAVIGQWYTLEGSYTTLTNNPRDKMSINFHASGATGAVLEVAEIVARPMASSELIVDGAVISRTIATDAVVARTIAANQIEAGHIKSNAITSDKINAGAITTAKLDAGAVTVDKLAAKSITVDKMAIGDYTNVATGSDFENANIVPWDMSAPAFSVSTSASRAHSGTRSMSINGAAANGSVSLLTPVDANAGERWYIEFWISRSPTWNGTANDSKLRVGDQANSHIYSITYTSSDIGPANAAPIKMSGQFTVPAGATGLRFQIGNGATRGYVWIDDIIIRRMTGGELIVNGSITGDKIEANAINGKTITGALIRSAASGARTEMTDQGIQVLDGASNPLVRLGYGIATGMQVRNPIGGALIPLGPHVFGTQGFTKTNNLNVTAGASGQWGSYTDEYLGPEVLASPTGRMLVFAQVNLSYNSALDTEFQIVADLSSQSGSVRFIDHMPLYGGAMTHVAIVNVVAGRTYRPFFAIRGRSGTSGRVSTFVLRTMVAMPI